MQQMSAKGIHIHRMSKCTFSHMWKGSKRTVWNLWENVQDKGNVIHTHIGSA